MLHKNFPFLEEIVEDKNGNPQYLQKKEQFILEKRLKKKGPLYKTENRDMTYY